MAIKGKVLVPLIGIGALFAIVGSQFQDLSPTQKNKNREDARMVYLTVVSKERSAVAFYSYGDPELPVTVNRTTWKDNQMVPIGTKVTIRIMPNDAKSVNVLACGIAQTGKAGDHKRVPASSLSCEWTVL